MHWISVDKNSKVPMIRQIYGQIRERILAGRLKPETRLPATRALAAELSVSRNVVLEAYDLLYSEGFTESRRGSGTFVAAGAAMAVAPAKAAPAAEAVTMGYDCPPGVINFKPGTPDLSLFPERTWLKMLREVFETPMAQMLAYGHPEGRVELREAICDYIVTQRGVVCHPDQIVVTAGTTQAIGIACHLLLQERKNVVLEDPITRDIQLIVSACGGTVHPVPVDDLGLVTGELPEGLSPAFLYVTPSHQFPVGGTLPIQRRIALLKYAEKEGAYVIEDDYDSEFRFDGPPVSSLHGLSPDRVVYIGTFSKTLCPAIRIGYLVLPPELITLGRSRKWHSDLHNEIVSQLALAGFIRKGYYLRHVCRMKKCYRERRKIVAACLCETFAGKVKILGSAAGLHLVAQFDGVSFTSDLLATLEKEGARFYPVEMHAILPGRHLDKLLIGYGNLTEKEIRAGIDILSKVLQRPSH